MKSKLFTILAISATALVASAPVPVLGSGDAGKTTVLATSDLKWKDMGIPGVVAAPVSGDMDKGPSRFFLKYPVGLVTPKHHHSADHYVAVISGTITLTVDGKEHRLGPGSYFALTGKASHIAKVEGNEEAVFFIQADGPWDVVPEK
jgi:mannose-6-phosphate isomerase-like protein (cupin superfamily)